MTVTTPFLLPSKNTAIIAGINALLRREAWALSLLQQHQHKTLTLEVAPFVIDVRIDEQGTLQALDGSLNPDAHLTVQWHKLSALITTLNTSSSLQTKPDLAQIMHIVGDAGLAQTVATIAQSLRWDVEADLARVIGDWPALKALELFQQLRKGTTRVAQRSIENMAEYLSEEACILTPVQCWDDWKNKYESFNKRVEQLQHDMSLISARIARVEAKNDDNPRFA